MAETQTQVKKTSRVVDTWKMKRWYKVISPASFGSQIMGETVALEEPMLIGRTLTTSLMTLTGDPKKQSINATFEIINVKNGNAETKLKKLEISPSSVRRMVRKGKERIDMSLLCETKDKIILRVKPLLLTRGKVGGSLLTAMRHLADALVRIEANKVSFEELVQEILTSKLQRTIKQRVSKLYPLKSVEIRAVELAVAEKPLPPIPELPELKEEVVEETEEEKIEKKVKAKKEKAEEEVKEALKEEIKEAKEEKKAKVKQAKKEE